MSKLHKHIQSSVVRIIDIAYPRDWHEFCIFAGFYRELYDKIIEKEERYNYRQFCDELKRVNINGDDRGRSVNEQNGGAPESQSLLNPAVGVSEGAANPARSSPAALSEPPHVPPCHDVSTEIMHSY